MLGRNKLETELLDWIATSLPRWQYYCKNEIIVGLSMVNCQENADADFNAF